MIGIRFLLFNVPEFFSLPCMIKVSDMIFYIFFVLFLIYLLQI